KTLKSYESTLLPVLKQLGRVAMADLTRPMLETYLNDLTHLSYTTHHRHQAILQSLLNFAVERHHLATNPIATLHQRKPDRAKGEHESDEIIRYLTPEQVQDVYTAVKTDVRLSAIIALLHRTGARIDELLSLDLEQVNLNAQKFQVIGKGNKQRWCFYSDDAAISLGKYLKYYQHPNHTALFTAQHPKSHRIGRVSYSTIYKSWQRLIASYETLQGARLHDLRHTFATERVGLMSLEELRALMGHQTIQTTLRYQKVTSHRAEVIARKAFDSLIFSTA
ncbi:MAG: tyrosine-type recombinase/integrase, partial [Phormidesmis sp. CAN_BIN44]|nr:tyrosine-type recombinase/integrase [Phormidesmis sp. CAN_BIN44]